EVFHLETASAPAPPAPDLAAKPFTVAALVDGRDGVVAAQGGASYGYALRLEGGVPLLTLTNRDQRFEVRGAALPAGPKHLAGTLDADGQLRLYVDGRQVAQARGEVLEQQPSDGLTLGRDGGSAVGPYSDDQALRGTWAHMRFAFGAEHDLMAWAQAARRR
ncbi:MAG: LamG domain-containing protein, partial [Pirellulales bacterium]|nr:LamG domain-containing protein [Pirellulales bacterium]